MCKAWSSCHIMLTFTSHHVEPLFHPLCGLNTHFTDITSGANSYAMSQAQNIIQIYSLTVDNPSICGCQTAVSGVWNYLQFSSRYGTRLLMLVPTWKPVTLAWLWVAFASRILRPSHSSWLWLGLDLWGGSATNHMYYRETAQLWHESFALVSFNGLLN